MIQMLDPDQIFNTKSGSEFSKRRIRIGPKYLDAVPQILITLTVILESHYDFKILWKKISFIRCLKGRRNNVNKD